MMRRFFLGGGKKDRDKQQQQQQQQAQKGKERDSQQQIAANGIHGNDSNDVAASSSAPIVPSKQVAFAAEVSRRSAPLLDQLEDDNEQQRHEVQSQVSHHSGALACFPAARAQHPVNTTGPTQVPSHPVRHPQQISNIDNNATVRAGPVSPGATYTTTRGDIPRFNNDIHLTSHEPVQRSTTSLSQNTTASNASSSFGGHGTSSNSHSNTNFYGSQLAHSHYPNLAILATYARDVNALNGGNGIVQHLTWSEITDDDLVENLGGRERTRQEVLFEMVCSEERYVQELLSLKENYLDPLLSTSSGISNTQTPAQTIRSISSVPATVNNATMKSTESLEVRRPLLELSTNSRAGFRSSTSPIHRDFATTNTGTMNVTNLAIPDGGGNASADFLPIAARFARGTSVDLAAPAAGGLASSMNTTRTTATTASPSSDSDTFVHPSNGAGRRDISGGTTASAGTTTTGLTSLSSNSGEKLEGAQQYATASSSKSKLSSRFSPLFHSSNTSKTTHTISSSTLPDSNTPGSDSIGTVNIPKAFRHHLKSLAPPQHNKLHKNSGLQETALVIPEDLRVVCETVVGSLLEGHRSLSERLRARYEEQYPLVRTLADVFTDQAWMVQHYASYVLHLEKALEDIEEAFQLVNPVLATQKTKKGKDREMLKEQKRLAKVIMTLEEEAHMRGAPGLSICLSQPFQRLLKYPLLFQSLLYHTDPSTRDYDATQQLAFEIDAIVRSIENEKVSEEERVRTRDCWARIEGINDKTLMTPRPDRLLVSEKAMWASPSPALAAMRRTFSDAGRDMKSIEEAQREAAAMKNKKSHRRLSDFVPGQQQHDGKEKQKKQPSIGSKRDVWVLTFTDVVIRCQRVGVTKLPMGLDHYSPKDKDNKNTTAKKYISLAKQERNLYRFMKVDHWVMADQTTREGVVSMVEVARSRSSQRIEEDPLSESEAEQAYERTRKQTDKSGGDSRMSFTYSNDEPRPAFDVDPLIGLIRQPSSPTRRPVAASRNFSPTTQEVVRKQGVANAKFGNRVRPSLGESPSPPSISPAMATAARASGARTVSPTTTTRPPAEKGGFNRPTAAYLAKAAAMQQTRHHASPPPAMLTAAQRRNETSPLPLPEPKRVRAASSNTTNSPSNSPPTSAQNTPKMPSRVRRSSFSAVSSDGGKGSHLRKKHSSERLGHRRQGSDMDSGVALFNQYWHDDDRTA